MDKGVRQRNTAPKMRTETIIRRELEHSKARAASRAELIRRLQEKADLAGPESIWAEMLAEAIR